MAQNISGLFNYDSPETIQTNYLNTLAARRPRGGGDLYSQLANAGGNIGGLLGYALGGLAGYKPAGMEKAEMIDQIMAEAAKGSSPLAQATRAYELFSAQGMGREAQIAMERLDELKKEQQAQGFNVFMGAEGTQFNTPEDYYKAAKMAFAAGDQKSGISMMTAGQALAKENEQKEKDKKTIDRRLRGVQAQSPNLPAELAQSVAEDADLYKEWSKTIFDAKKEKNNVSYQDINGNTELLVTDPQGNLVRRVVLGKAPEKGTRVEVGLDMRGQGKYAETVGTEVAKKDVALVTNVETAAKNLPKINQALDILQKGDPTTGIGAELILNVNRVRSQFLKDKKAGKSVTDTQVLDALLGSDVFPMIDALGIGARGLDTPAEREFLRNVFTGTIQMDKNTLVKLTEIRKNIAERAVKDYNDKLGSGYFTKYEEALGRKLQPVQLQTGGTTTSKGTTFRIIEE